MLLLLPSSLVQCFIKLLLPLLLLHCLICRCHVHHMASWLASIALTGSQLLDKLQQQQQQAARWACHWQMQQRLCRQCRQQQQQQQQQQVQVLPAIPLLLLLLRMRLLAVLMKQLQMGKNVKRQHQLLVMRTMLCCVLKQG
jgi:hypothetical protein